MKDIKLGKLISETENRDAVHIAIAPVSANERVYPGDHVALVAGTTDKVQTLRGAENEGAGIGIVDPFLTHPVSPGVKFWLLLYPQTITSLRHEWTHPAFSAVNIEKSRQWLEERAERIGGVSCDDMIAVLMLEEYRGSFGCDIDGDREIEPELWTHLEVVTGVAVPEEKRPAYFHCAC